MKTFIAAIALIPLLVPNASAGCGVRCNSSYVTPFVQVPYAVALGVPVAQVNPYAYTYTPQQPPQAITVNISLDGKTLQALSTGTADQPAEQPPRLLTAPQAPPAPGPLRPEAPSQFPGFDRCVACHAPGGKPNALAKFNLSQFATLDCKLKLRAINDVQTERMPPPNDPLGGKLNADEAGAVIGALSKQ